MFEKKDYYPMVCAMHRLFQSEEDDLIMEGKGLPKETNQETSSADKKEPPKVTLGARLLKSLEKLRKSSANT